ncbi:MAG: formamidopyrimidine-DNA glycosylase [Planctomycetaceae bacterium]|nr:formamidopyrimidine-DNA glycosylase [Planctomycetaceae bacterium]
MPELPDITVYIEAIESRVVGQPLENVRVASPFLLRSFDPPLEEAIGRQIVELRRLGKRIAFGLEGDLWLVLHLMIAGRLQWKAPKAKIPGGKIGLAAFDFLNGTLTLTEAGSKKRASLHIVRAGDLDAHQPGGLEPLDATEQQFVEVLRSSNHTLKRALTNPRLFSGIGNAYSDEILHAARLSPVTLTCKLTDEDAVRLYSATKLTLQHWIELLRKQTGGGFPAKVTAFRPEMAAHGRYGQPCPECSSPIQRIRYADNETNYCATCQTGGKVLADRSLSRLLKQDWPRRIEEWE